VSELGATSPERGGRAKRYFSLTPRGRREVREAQRALTTLWQDVPSFAGGKA
jgi:PadR family transcriptional regulator